MINDKTKKILLALVRREQSMLCAYEAAIAATDKGSRLRTALTSLYQMALDDSADTQRVVYAAVGSPSIQELRDSMGDIMALDDEDIDETGGSQKP